MAQKPTVKASIIAGYTLMTILSVLGIEWIYSEWMHHYKLTESYEKRTDLVNLSNTFAAMYQTESLWGLNSIITDTILKVEYDSLLNAVFNQINLLKNTSENVHMTGQLDSLQILLHEKRNNVMELDSLLRFSNEDFIYSTIKTQVVTKKDLGVVDDILENTLQKVENADTAVVVGEKKGLFKRLGDAIKSNRPDTITQINIHTEATIKNIVVPKLKDTIVEIIETNNRKYKKKNAKVLALMLQKQTELYNINEQTTAHINAILVSLNAQEEFISNELYQQRAEMIRKSSRIVSIIAIAAILVSLTFILWTIQAISKGQRLQRELEARKKEVENLLKSRKQLMLTITHDIKTPINSIMGYLELIREDLSPSTISYADNMQYSAKHILNMVRKLLDFYSIEENQQEIELFPFSPQALLSEIYESFVPAAYEKKIDFKSSLDIARNIHCISDTFRIRQIVDNLLSNAFKFTPRNGKIILAASISNDKQQPELIVSVKDSGIGIKAQDKEHIFESFKRFNHKELMAEGAGLGLAITQKLVELLGGKISVESELGKGSLFKVNIPVSDVTKKEDVPPEKKSLIPKENMTVLFVDDDSIQLNLFSEFMKKEKIKAFTCSSYDEALAVLQKESFDIIFSDIQMGDRDGFELVDYIRHSDTIKGKKEIPIIALTGQMEFSITRYLHAGFSDFLLKPFTYNQLIKLINKYIPTSTCKEEKEKPQKKASFNALLEFAGGDKHAEKKIIDSFIHETSKNYQALKAALEDKNTNEIKKIAHKMTPTMRMISENTIADLLQSYEQGIENKEDESLLLKLIAEKIREAEQFFERNN